VTLSRKQIKLSKIRETKEGLLCNKKNNAIFNSTMQLLFSDKANTKITQRCFDQYRSFNAVRLCAKTYICVEHVRTVFYNRANNAVDMDD